MQRLEVSCAVQPIYGLLGAKGLTKHFIPVLILISLLVWPVFIYIYLPVYIYPV
jgi:hypothetical protein